VRVRNEGKRGTNQPTVHSESLEGTNDYRARHSQEYIARVTQTTHTLFVVERLLLRGDMISISIQALS
jgi:hypothetical protein